MSKDYKKPEIRVEALQFDGSEEGAKRLAYFAGDCKYELNEGRLRIFTDSSIVRLCKTDYIVKYEDGLCYAWKKHMFEDVFKPSAEVTALLCSQILN